MDGGRRRGAQQGRCVAGDLSGGSDGWPYSRSGASCGTQKYISLSLILKPIKTIKKYAAMSARLQLLLHAVYMLT